MCRQKRASPATATGEAWAAAERTRYLRDVQYHPFKPLVQHVWERCQQCKAVDDVIIATDDERIVAAAERTLAVRPARRKAGPVERRVWTCWLPRPKV